MTPGVDFSEARRFWIRLGFLSFGGPAGQIAILHREVVEVRKWVSEERFLHALNFCMLLPGPEAQQLATYIGWLLHGPRGGLFAGILFVLPSIFVLLALSYIYAAYGSVASVAAVLWGFKPAVAGVVFEAVVRIGRRTLRRGFHFVLAASAFIAIYFLGVPFPAIVLAAALAGMAFASSLGTRDEGPLPERAPGAGRNAFRTAAIGVGLWAALLAVVVAIRGWDSLHAQQYRFFTQAAFVTFGGAYAVLTYVTQAAVESFGWISRTEAIDGLALAETTPGPLIIVLQFVGFLAAWHRPEGLSPLASGITGALVTTWTTFLPSTLFILVAAPYVEQLRASPRLQAALQGITAAVVGIILNLGLVFGLAVIQPEGCGGGIDVLALGLSALAFLLLFRFHVGVHWVVIAFGLVGLVRIPFSS